MKRFIPDKLTEPANTPVSEPISLIPFTPASPALSWFDHHCIYPG